MQEFYAFLEEEESRVEGKWSLAPAPTISALFSPLANDAMARHGMGGRTAEEKLTAGAGTEFLFMLFPALFSGPVVAPPELRARFNDPCNSLVWCVA